EITSQKLRSDSVQSACFRLPGSLVPVGKNSFPDGCRSVIITTRDGKTIDTEKDLTAVERHILQKLFLWKSMADSLDQFREKRAQALLKGWNNSGPIGESQNLRAVIMDLEEKVVARLKEEHAGKP
ncbi:MAG: hypothetical protein PHS17_04790, partial [Desulfobacterales bacterium]|nr:hypothetical protein [Desulfobacterales bacterium]